MVAKRFQSFGQSIFAEYTALAIKHNAINLSQGFPDFDGPKLAKDAAIAAINAGHSQYAPMTGVPVLRNAIADNWNKRGAFQIEADSWVTVTCGCSEAITCCFAGLLNPGDEVIIFEPYFDYYGAGLAWADARARYVTLHAPQQTGGAFWFDENELRAAFSPMGASKTTPKVRAIILNTPHNPTGKVFTRSELELIAKLCVEHDVVCISDEVYEHLTYEPSLPHLSIATFPGMKERTITLSSLGKSFSLTGWKVGWSIAPPELSACVRAAHQFNSFSGATPMQHAAAAMINAAGIDGGETTRDLRKLFIRNRDVLSGALRRAGLDVYRSDSTYFLMADHSTVTKRLGLTGEKSADRLFCEFLTREIGVAAIPPSVFYEHKQFATPLVRFAFCKKSETIDEAVKRLAKL
ncbi:MAG: aminotransferase class I/II-fold pyridoxal phosphate-dependent enzyme [Phycisphaerales bacterium]